MILHWDVYEIRCSEEALHGVKLRGRIRKFTIENEVTCLMENASDEHNAVRFALVTGCDPKRVSDFVKALLPESDVTGVLKNVPNPVLSKLKVNDLSRYEI